MTCTGRPPAPPGKPGAPHVHPGSRRPPGNGGRGGRGCPPAPGWAEGRADWTRTCTDASVPPSEVEMYAPSRPAPRPRHRASLRQMSHPAHSGEQPPGHMSARGRGMGDCLGPRTRPGRCSVPELHSKMVTFMCVSQFNTFEKAESTPSLRELPAGRRLVRPHRPGAPGPPRTRAAWARAWPRPLGTSEPHHVVACVQRSLSLPTSVASEEHVATCLCPAGGHPGVSWGYSVPSTAPALSFGSLAASRLHSFRVCA